MDADAQRRDGNSRPSKVEFTKLSEEDIRDHGYCLKSEIVWDDLSEPVLLKCLLRFQLMFGE